LRFVFTKFFYLLAALGFVPLAFAWQRSWLAWVALGYDVLLLIAAIVDAQISQLPRGFRVSRHFGGRFAMGAETEVRIQIENASNRAISLTLKDEFPPQMILKGEREGDVRVPAHGTAALIYGLTPPRRGRFEFGHTALRFRSRLNLVWRDARGAEPVAVKVYPNMRRAREAELKALGARSVVSSHRKTSWRGEGREFESMRDYVRGDELRHISWTATARRGKLTTRQYQIERDQTILVALDAGRLMTARIEQETKLDSAVHATLALFSAACGGGP
jgi:uncharacterized protein (DUF58 family)